MIHRVEPGQRVLDVMVDGADIDRQGTFSFAVNDYLAGGGDGFSMLPDKRRIVDENAAVLMTNQLFDYISTRREISPTVDGRLQAIQ